MKDYKAIFEATMENEKGLEQVKTDIAFMNEEKKEQKIKNRCNSLYTKEVHLENFDEALEVFLDYSAHNNAMRTENLVATDQMLEHAKLGVSASKRKYSASKSHITLTESDRNNGFNVSIYRLRNPELFVCYDPDLDGYTYAIFQIELEGEKINVRVFANDITQDKDCHLNRLEEHYQKALETAKIVLADAILEQRTYTKTTSMLDKMLHPALHASNLRFFNTKINTSKSIVDDYQKELKIIEITKKIISQRGIKKEDDPVLDSICLGNRYGIAEIRKQELEARLKRFTGPEMVVPFDAYLERPEVNVQETERKLRKFVTYLRANNINLRFSDNTTGFDISEHVDFGTFKYEILAFLEFLDKNPEFTNESSLQSSSDNDDNNDL